MFGKMYIEEGKIDKSKFLSCCKFSGDALSFQDCIVAIIDRINEAEDKAEKYRNKLVEYSKDEEIVKLKEEMKTIRESSYRGFSISAKEKENINEWIKEHEESKHGLITLDQKLKSQGCCGGKYVYEFVPTSIGTIGTIKCGCGDEFTFQEL